MIHKSDSNTFHAILKKVVYATHDDVKITDDALLNTISIMYFRVNVKKNLILLRFLLNSGEFTEGEETKYNNKLGKSSDVVKKGA